MTAASRAACSRIKIGRAVAGLARSTKNMMPDESAEDEDVDVPSSRQQEYANAVLDQLDDGNSGSVKSSDYDQPRF